MRLLDWNIEHMNSWFVSNSDPSAPALRDEFGGSPFGGGPIRDVPALAKRVANVINKTQPDVLCIQEGAGGDEVAEFLKEFVAGEWSVLQGSGSSQKLVIAARTDGVVTSLEPVDDSALENPLDADFVADTDGDSVEEEDTRFTRVPQVAEVIAHDRRVRIVNAHLKSKFVSNGEQLFKGTTAERRHFIREALIARRRISAEAFRIRTYLDELLEKQPDRLVLVAGDLNDGPGFDFFERRFLTHSVIDLVFGSVLQPEHRLTHALIRPGEQQFTAVFDDFVEGKKDKPLLLDHVGLSPALVAWMQEARVAHSEFDAEVVSTAPTSRERAPSDHRPVVVELTPPS